MLLASTSGCQGDEASVEVAGSESPLATRTQQLTCTSLVPFMTSATLPSGNVTRSGVLSSSYEAWLAFDSNDSAPSMWLSQVGQTPAWLGYQWADGAKRATHYAIRFVNGSLTSRAPRNWTLQGWNGTAWVVVDTRPNEVGWGGSERREYAVASPGSFTQYRLNVTDDNDSRAPTIETVSIGRLELLNCIMDTQAPAAPVLTSFTPASPSSNTQPVLAGTAEASSTVRIFSGASCSGTAVATVTANASGAFTSVRPVTANATSTFTATATDAAGNVSPCSTSLGYLHDGLAPAAPVLTGFSPASPSSSTQPVLSGTAEVSSTVRIFSGASCTGTALATVTVAANGTFSSTRSVTLNATSTFTATATDAAGNVSVCSSSLSYRHDSIVPAAPVLTGFTPASPSNSTQPVLSGTAEAGASVRIFSGASCAGSVLATVPVAADNTFSSLRSVTANTTSTFTARAVDAAGNVSACSTSLGYRHDSVPPSAPSLTGFTPASPGQSLTPQLRGTAEQGSSVRLFSGGGCLAPVLATLTADATTGAFATSVAVATNAATGFSARAVDAVGNVSNCSATATYVHDTVAPAPPVFAQDFIPIDTSPFVGVVRTQTEPQGRVSLFTDAACTAVAPPGMVAQADASGTAHVALTQAQIDVTVFAVAHDAAGNRSVCVSFEVGCAVGFADCDGNPVNGCESDLLLDEANCGACGTTCGGALSANGVCGAGTCGLGCVVGTFDCDGLAANGCESASACNAAVCQVDAPEELLINALSVVEDPVRTTGAGAWTFGTLMRAMNGGADPSGLVRNWLRTWEQDQFIEATFVPARPGMRGLVLGPWEARSGGANAPLDFNSAPFRLLAIVNRMDLRNEGTHAGEGRFVFGVLDPAGNPTPFTVILEYTLPGGSPDEIQRWSRDWHELGRLGVSHPDYNAKLQAVTDRFTKAFVARGRFLGSAISQVRTNENALEPEWELREFHFGPAGLAPAHVALTPAFFLNGSPLLTDYILQNRPAILTGTHDVPQFFQGQPFLWGSALTPFFFFWDAPGVDSEARHQFSLNTCNGCHAGETQTVFLHVGPRSPGQTAFLSPFMVSTAPIPDPLTGAPRVFNDLGRRTVDLKALVCGVPPSLARDAVGESLLAPARPAASAVPGFPARSNLPAGRVH
ncbi:Ig-like domain-containing protein [Pyxidicoccus trucidator]|uniref:Ig-like domain-containing protein n=1 Tax=Pyxidicoccus trucidator TaxID=2709662 RepID=UPI001968A180|nr:Ig-like domain-containing protein [Pyxidicoccus trucidator]